MYASRLREGLHVACLLLIVKQKYPSQPHFIAQENMHSGHSLRCDQPQVSDLDSLSAQIATKALSG